MQENILELIRICKTYDKFVLKDINLTLPRGYIMGFIGANGAGKTTTIKLIMNMIKRDSGEIKVFGLDNVENEVSIKNKIGYVGEEPVFYEDMTVEWTANFTKKFFYNWDDKQFEELLRRFNLDKKKKLKQLSKGMKMKTALALALSHDPDLLILDEPTSGLDPIVRDELLDILMSFIQDEKKSVFFSSHITSDIEKIADFVTIIHDGEIVLSQEKDDILQRLKLVKGDVRRLGELSQDLLGVTCRGESFEALTKDYIDFKKRHDTAGLIIDQASLDDILLYSTKRGNGDASFSL